MGDLAVIAPEDGSVAGFPSFRLLKEAQMKAKLSQLVVIVLFVLALAVTSCGGPREYAAYSLDQEICKNTQRNDYVQVSGVLKLPDVVLVGNKQMRVLLVQDLSQDQPWLGLLIDVGKGNNQMEPLPENYTLDDFVVRTDDGRMIGHGANVTVSGRIESTINCELEVEKIE
jgi:hypothetical protein